MKKIQRHRSNIILTVLVLLCVIGLISILVFLKLSPVYSPVTSENVARTNIYAPYDFYDRIGTEQRARNAYENQKPEVVRINDAMFVAFESVIQFFQNTEEYRMEMSLRFPTQEATDSHRANIMGLFHSYAAGRGISLTTDEAALLLHTLGDTEYRYFVSHFKLMFANLQTSNIFSNNKETKIRSVREEAATRFTGEELPQITEKITEAFLRINSIENEELTQKARQQAFDNVIRNSPVIIISGSRIASRNDILTGDQIRLLHDMGILRDETFDPWMYMSVLVLLLLIGYLVFASVRIVGMGCKYDWKKILIGGIVLLLIFLLAFFIPGEYRYYIPALAIPMLIAVLLDPKSATILSVASAFGLTVMLQADAFFTLMLITGGILSVYLIRKTNVRLKVALSGFVTGLACILVLAARILLPGGEDWTVLLRQGIQVMVACVGASIITLGLLPVFEGVFNIITPFKLLEISNPNQPLLKKLMMEAPGTYHHSLMVGNLAEAGADAVGADGLLARVGAYYHDIGKMNRPGFFTENQDCMQNPHDKMTPSLSTFVIVNHTKGGAELARKYKLPHPIRDIVEEHHGTTKVQYFYEKAKQAAGEKPVKTEEFRYPGPKPRTVEAAVVLMADAVEAAIRSMRTGTRGTIEGMIRRIIKEKIDDDQFSQCALTFKDFDDIADAFTKVATGYSHQRIQYYAGKGEQPVEPKGT